MKLYSKNKQHRSKWCDTIYFLANYSKYLNSYLAIIANSAVQSSTQTLFTMLICSWTLQQCLIQQSRFFWLGHIKMSQYKNEWTSGYQSETPIVVTCKLIPVPVLFCLEPLDSFKSHWFFINTCYWRIFVWPSHEEILSIQLNKINLSII